MDFFVNTEFIDLDRRIDLISLTVVAADGRELYAVSTEFDPAPPTPSCAASCCRCSSRAITRHG